MNNIINISHYDIHNCNNNIIIIIIKFIILSATSHVPLIQRAAIKFTRHCTAYLIVFFWVRLIY